MKFIIVLVLVMIQAKRVHQRHEIQQLAGGIKYSSPQDVEDQKGLATAVVFAKEHYQEACSTKASWNKLNKVGFQIVAGQMFYLDVLLGNDIYEIKVWLKVPSGIQISGCRKL